MVVRTANIMKRNLAMAWIDYKKVFDSMLHSWILASLNNSGSCHNYPICVIISPKSFNFPIDVCLQLLHGQFEWLYFARQRKFCRLVKKHESGKAKHSLMKEAKAIKNKYLLLRTAQIISESVAKGQLSEGENRRTARETNAWSIFCSLEKPFVDKKQVVLG